LGVVAHSFVQLPQLEGLVSAFGHLADDAGRLASDDAEARYDHVRRHDGSVEDADVVLYDGKLADDDVLADVDVAADGGSLHDGAFTDEDVIAEPEG
jgi:hypothetical protein